MIVTKIYGIVRYFVARTVHENCTGDTMHWNYFLDITIYVT